MPPSWARNVEQYIEGKAEMVLRVKSVQRAGGANKERWSRFVERHGSTIGRPPKHDPNAHDEEFLRQFFIELEAGTIPVESEDYYQDSNSPSLPNSVVEQATAQLSADGHKASLVMRIKGLQRSDPLGKQRWINFCEMHGHRKHDPNTHDEVFLSVFLEALDRGEIPLEPSPTASTLANGAASGKDALVIRVKQVQRSSPDGKHKWIYFCESWGQKKHDPAAHDEHFLQEFLSSLERGDLPADATGKIELVQKVKELQRRDPEGKQKWTEYCDRHGHGKHDPNIYDMEFLKAFFENSEPPPNGARRAVAKDQAPVDMASYMQMMAVQQAAWQQQGSSTPPQQQLVPPSGWSQQQTAAGNGGGAFQYPSEYQAPPLVPPGWAS